MGLVHYIRTTDRDGNMDCPRSTMDFVGPSRASGTQINYKHCPVCGNTKWKVYLDPISGRWYCFAGGHSAGGCVEVGLPSTGAGRQVLDRLNGNSRGVSRTEWPEVQLPPFTDLTPRARRYLNKRGLSNETIDKFSLVEWDDPDKFRVLFPFFGPQGRIIYWNSRAYSSLDDGPKYVAAPGKHPLYVVPRWEPGAVRVVTEGVFDAVMVYQWTGISALALCGKSLPRYLEADFLALTQSSTRLLLDGDALSAALRIRARFSDRRTIRVVPLPVNEDPASMGLRLKELLCE